MVSPLATYFNHFRRKYHNFQLSIVNFPFVRQHTKLQFTHNLSCARLFLYDFFQSGPVIPLGHDKQAVKQRRQ